MLRHITLIMLLLLGSHGIAAAGGTAFIGLADAGQPSWGRDLAVQEALQTGLGFDEVDLNANTTPGELAAGAAAFLARAGAPGTRRLVWISGPASGPDSPCPATDAPLFRPAVPAVVLAPACFGDVLDLPVGALHLTLREMRPDAARRLTDRNAQGVETVFIALPDDNNAVIEAANAIVLNTIAEAGRTGSSHLSPLVLLQRLRLELRIDGSDYVPTLDAFPRTAAWSRHYLAPVAAAPRPAVRPGAVPPPRFDSRRPAMHPVALYSRPGATAVAAVTVDGRAPFDFIRRSRDGRMGYVRTVEGLFGWVRSDALAP